jgi:hypothetical protein
VPYGWPEPFDSSAGYGVNVLVSFKEYPIKDVRNTAIIPCGDLNMVIKVERAGDTSIISLEDGDSSPHRPTTKAPGTSQSAGVPLQIECKLSQLGISLVGELPVPQELLYIHLDLVRFEMQSQADGVQQFSLAVSDAQVNCQIPGRVDAKTRDERKKDALLFKDAQSPAVIVSNNADSERAFLHLVLQRGATSSRDLCVPKAEIALDGLHVDVDTEFLDAFVAFMQQSVSTNEFGVPLHYISQSAGKPITLDFSPPPLPWVLEVTSLKISELSLQLWARMKLESLSFLPKIWRHAIAVLSLQGDELTLEGAQITLPMKKLPPHRGSLTDFVRSLVTEYAGAFLKDAASVLGKSSLLNVPMAPLKIGGTAFAFMSDSVGLVAGEVGSLLSNLAFDDDYIRKQQQSRANKKIRGVGDGLAEAGGTLLAGVEGLKDIVTKPVQGARASGFGGFLKGAVKGVTGAVVKPIAAVGQAVQDVGTGLANTMSADTQEMKERRERVRSRLPRMLFTDLGVLRKWSRLEAEVQSQLGSALTRGAIEIILLNQVANLRNVLLLFNSRLVYVPVKVSRESNEQLQRQETTGVLASAEKVMAHNLKPVNTLLYGVQNVAGKGSANHSAETGTEPDLAERATQFVFTNLKEVRLKPLAGLHGASDILEMTDTDGVVHPLHMPLVSTIVKDVLVNGLRSALGASRHGVANWEPLRKVLEAEHRLREVDDSAEGDETSGQKILEVFEFQRFHSMSREWRTPFHAIWDSEASWRWMDASGSRHPQLTSKDDKDKKQMVLAHVPPCAFNMFKPVSEWKIDVQPGTDTNGWRYSLGWNNSTWDSKPGSFNRVRKRLWRSTFA